MTALATANFLPNVKAQYEALPYPERDPQGELKMLRVTNSGRLEYLNHHAFGGQLKLDGLRLLDAGGGTGNSTIFMAEQLREFGGSVTYVDMSSASLAIAKECAEIRKLDNIEFVHMSLLDIPKMDWEPFDVITSYGVLHHLASPEAGLNALKAALKPGGVMDIMVYATYGRRDVYQMQRLMKLVNHQIDDGDVPSRIDRYKQVAQLVGQTEWFQRCARQFTDVNQLGDSGIYDLFLHTQDRAYLIDELYDWVEGCGLHMHYYQPDAKRPLSPAILPAGPMRDWLLEQDQRMQLSVLEAMRGDIAKHSIYVTPEPRESVAFDNPEMIPSFTMVNPKIPQLIEQMPDGETSTLQVREGVNCDVIMSEANRALLPMIDGQRTVGEIAAEMAAQFGIAQPEMLRHVAAALASLAAHDVLYLRHQSVPRAKPFQQLQAEMLKRRG